MATGGDRGRDETVKRLAQRIAWLLDRYFDWMGAPPPETSE